MVKAQSSNPDQPLTYQIRLRGHLDETWEDWFDGVTITREENGETLLTCRVPDQAALHGLLRRVRDLGIPLISVVCLNPGPSHDPDVQT
jgi:hypothetical protein